MEPVLYIVQDAADNAFLDLTDLPTRFCHLNPAPRSKAQSSLRQKSPQQGGDHAGRLHL